MTKVTIIADDFTGSNDTAVRFSKLGLNTVVTTDTQNFNELKADVVAVDTETRHVDQKTAYQLLKEVAARCNHNFNDSYIYKKIDSTLRGNLGTEIDAIMSELSIPTAVMVPAMPSTDRKTIGGYQIVAGVPLQSTDIGKDPLNPVTESYVPHLLEQQLQRPVSLITLHHVLAGKEALIRALQKVVRKSGEIIIIDAATMADLTTIATALKELKLLAFTIGPADFAGELAKLIVEQPSKTQRHLVLAVAGSVNQVTINQVKYLANRTDIKNISIRTENLFSEQDIAAEKQRLIGKVHEALNQGKDIVLRTVKSKADVEHTLDVATKNGFSHKKAIKQLSVGIGFLAADLIKYYKFPGVILTGGDIAISTYQALGLKGVKIHDEILPGIPYGTVDSGEYQGLRVITKAGAFGDEKTLMKCINFLRGSERNE